MKLLGKYERNFDFLDLDHWIDALTVLLAPNVTCVNHLQPLKQTWTSPILLIQTLLIKQNWTITEAMDRFNKLN